MLFCLWCCLKNSSPFFLYTRRNKKQQKATSLFCEKRSRFVPISSTFANKYRWKCTQRYIPLRVFCVFIFSSRFISMEKWRAHWALEKLLFFWCIFNPLLHFRKSRFLKKPTKRFDGGEKSRTRHTHTTFFSSLIELEQHARVYIYITHTQVWILQSCFRWQPAPRLFWANSFPRLPRSTSRSNNRNDTIKSTSKSPRCRTFPEIQTWRNFARDICSRKSRGSATRTWRKTRTRRLLV